MDNTDDLMKKAGLNDEDINKMVDALEASRVRTLEKVKDDPNKYSFADVVYMTVEEVMREMKFDTNNKIYMMLMFIGMSIGYHIAQAEKPEFNQF
jgi:hypothetical protein